MLPIANWMIPGITIAIIAVVSEISGVRSIIGIGRSVAIIDPTFGIKLRIKAISPKASARSMPSNVKTSPTNKPVALEIMIFVITKVLIRFSPSMNEGVIFRLVFLRLDINKKSTKMNTKILRENSPMMALKVARIMLPTFSPISCRSGDMASFRLTPNFSMVIILTMCELKALIFVW